MCWILLCLCGTGVDTRWKSVKLPYLVTCNFFNSEIRAFGQLASYSGHWHGGSRLHGLGTRLHASKLLTSYMSSMTMTISSSWGIVHSVKAPHSPASKVRMSNVYSTVGKYSEIIRQYSGNFKINVTYVSIMYASTPSPLAVHVCCILCAW